MGVFADYKRDLIDRWSDLRSLGLRGLFSATDQRARMVLTSPALLIVIRATQLTLGMVVFGLVLVGIFHNGPLPNQDDF